MLKPRHKDMGAFQFTHSIINNTILSANPRSKPQWIQATIDPNHNESKPLKVVSVVNNFYMHGAGDLAPAEVS